MVVRVTASLVERLREVKERVKAKLEASLDEKEIEQAVKDHHARREPIACGMTIHTGIGCRYGCIYCYVPDMGFPMKPQPYPLNGLQLVYALMTNPYVVPGPYGTMLAFGSVTEPFLEETMERAFEYLRATKEFMGNPTQIATKSYLDREASRKFKSSAEDRISVLVTIVTLRYAGKLEPSAPPPEKRFETIRNLSKLGIHVSLFLRPIIPGVTDPDMEKIIMAAKEAGAVGVVPGSLRVTPGILRRLEAAGISVKEIVARLPRKPRNARDQVTIREPDLKERVSVTARKYSLKVFPSSCSANMDAHGLACWICKWGPCGDPSKLPHVEDDGVREIVELFGLKPVSVRVRGNRVDIVVGRYDRGRVKRLYHWLSTLAKREVMIRRGG